VAGPILTKDFVYLIYKYIKKEAPKGASTDNGWGYHHWSFKPNRSLSFLFL
jgi:hypothetical protein